MKFALITFTYSLDTDKGTGRDGGHLVRFRERDPATGARPRVSSPPAQ